MTTITDPDIIQAELTILKAREEHLVYELEEIRASIAVYTNELEMKEEIYD